jgi:2-C-methyl-D-erythritol 4-phosphate cytidylyltransferase
MVTVDAILLGGGLGTRFAETSQMVNSELPKQFHLLGGTPVFVHCLQSFLEMGIFRQIILTSPKFHIRTAEDLIHKYVRNPNGIKIRVIAGGERRQDSSRLALEALEENQSSPTRVLIHDACRPYISDELAAQLKACLLDRAYGAWVPIIPVVDTLKKVKDHQVVETVDRSLVHRVQTPQIFEFSLIRSLMDRVKDLRELNFTDDASLCEYYGIPVGVFKGDVRNIKLTYDFELETLQGVLAEAKRAKTCAPESATTFTV